MSDGQNGKIDVFESRIFSKALSKLSNDLLEQVEDEIERIIENPEIGERKKGDLNHLWVHKFQLNNQLTLLGYSWVNDQLELYLLNIGPHENFYSQASKRRKSDLKLIK